MQDDEVKAILAHKIIWHLLKIEDNIDDFKNKSISQWIISQLKKEYMQYGKTFLDNISFFT